jgi:hypothetical protein
MQNKEKKNHQPSKNQTRGAPISSKYSKISLNKSNKALSKPKNKEPLSNPLYKTAMKKNQ